MRAKFVVKIVKLLLQCQKFGNHEECQKYIIREIMESELKCLMSLRCNIYFLSKRTFAQKYVKTKIQRNLLEWLTLHNGNL